LAPAALQDTFRETDVRVQKIKALGGTMRRRELLQAIPLLMTPALARADTRPLRFIPNANL
jgi:hypothetical protein